MRGNIVRHSADAVLLAAADAVANRTLELMGMAPTAQVIEFRQAVVDLDPADLRGNSNAAPYMGRQKRRCNTHRVCLTPNNGRPANKLVCPKSADFVAKVG
jgi:hypothetical protein